MAGTGEGGSFVENTKAPPFNRPHCDLLTSFIPCTFIHTRKRLHFLCLASLTLFPSPEDGQADV